MKGFLGLIIIIALVPLDGSAGFNPISGLWNLCVRSLSRGNPIVGKTFVQVPLSLFDTGPKQSAGRFVIAKIVSMDRDGVVLDSGLLQHDLKPWTKKVSLKTLRGLKSMLVPPSAGQAISGIKGIRQVHQNIGDYPFYAMGEGVILPTMVSHATQIVQISHSQVVSALQASEISTPALRFRIVYNLDSELALNAHVVRTIGAGGLLVHPDYLPADSTIVFGRNTLTNTIAAHEIAHEFDPSNGVANQRYLKLAFALPGVIAYDPLRETWADYLMYVSTRSPIVYWGDGKQVRNIGEKPTLRYFEFLRSRPIAHYEGNIPIHEESVYFTYLLFRLGQKFGERNVLKAFYDLRTKQYEDLTEEDTFGGVPHMGKSEAESAARQGITIANYLRRWIRTEHPDWEPEAIALLKDYGLID